MKKYGILILLLFPVLTIGLILSIINSYPSETTPVEFDTKIVSNRISQIIEKYNIANEDANVINKLTETLQQGYELNKLSINVLGGIFFYMIGIVVISLVQGLLIIFFWWFWVKRSKSL